MSEDDPALFLRALLTKGRQDSVASASSDGVRVMEVTSPHSVLHEHSYDVEEPETTDAEDSQDEDDDEQTLAGSQGEEDLLEEAEEDDEEPPPEEEGFPSILSPISERSEPGSSESRTPSPDEVNPVGEKLPRGYSASHSLHGTMRSLMDKLKMPRWSAVERLAALPPPSAHQRALAATLAVSEYSPRPSLASSGDESDDTLGERVVEGSEGTRQQPPKFTTELTDQKAKENSSEVEFKCAVSGVPRPEVTLFHNDLRLSLSRFVRILYVDDRVSLVLCDVTPDMAGQYTVRAVNPAGEATSTATLEVQELSEEEREELIKERQEAVEKRKKREQERIRRMEEKKRIQEETARKIREKK
ncbi:Telokin [Amphibalanus amphitrite]|uniref:Telokin n=1 Tax=Amphibalanus amphitrite TaxID=1232801 RepID=A0A6A4W0W6_AMPAM|nr:Telokin [Amphibalanus amphitrite]